MFTTNPFLVYALHPSHNSHSRIMTCECCGHQKINDADDPSIFNDTGSRAAKTIYRCTEKITYRVDGRHIIEDDEAEASRPLRSRIIFDLDRLDVAILPEVIFQFVFARLTDTSYENLGALVVMSHRARSVCQKRSADVMHTTRQGAQLG